MATYSSIDCAEYLRTLAIQQQQVLNTTKVQKLLFIAYGSVLADSGERLVDEHPQAWPFGPVFPRTRNKVDYNRVLSLDDARFEALLLDRDVTETLSLIIKKYSTYTASKLSSWSHSPNTPWERTTKQKGFAWGREIPDDFIREYFSQFDII